MSDSGEAMTQPTESGEQYPKSAMEWLADALGRFQITHCHASIREALKAMDTTEAATGGKVRCAAKDSEGLQCVLEQGHTRNSHVIHQVDDGASLWPSVPSTESVNRPMTDLLHGVFIVYPEEKFLAYADAQDALIATLRQQLEEAKRLLNTTSADFAEGVKELSQKLQAAEAKLAALGVGGGEVEYHYEDKQVLAVVQNTEYAKEKLRVALMNLTVDQKWSLYRAVATLAARRANASLSAEYADLDDKAKKMANALGNLFINTHDMRWTHRNSEGQNCFIWTTGTDKRCKHCTLYDSLKASVHGIAIALTGPAKEGEEQG